MNNEQSSTEDLFGEWWLPSDPSERRTGVLTYGDRTHPVLETLQGWHEPPKSLTSDGDAVSLVDDFAPQRASATHIPFVRHAIHGRTTTGLLITLLDGLDLPGTHFVSSGYHNRRHFGQAVVSGAHIDEPAKLVLKSLNLSNTALPFALNDSGFESRRLFANAPGGERQEVVFRRREPLVARVNRNSIRITIHWQEGYFSNPSVTSDMHSRSLTAQPVISIEPRRPRHFQELWELLVPPLGAFLEFCSGAQADWHRCEGVLDTTATRPVHISNSQIDWSNRHSSQECTPILHLDHIRGDRFERVLRFWFQMWPEHSGALNQGISARRESDAGERARRYVMALEAMGKIVLNDKQETTWRELKPHFRKAIDASGVKDEGGEDDGSHQERSTRRNPQGRPQ